MKIIETNRKRALFIIDVQPSFITARNKYIIDNIKKLLSGVKYDLYIIAKFHAEENSIWHKQQDWMCKKGNNTEVEQSIMATLNKYSPLIVEKQTKSVFKADKEVLEKLRNKGIREIHMVGLDTNDCVLATSYESFDLGFFTYVIEECTQSSSKQDLYDKAISLLRHQHMTNNSCIEKVNYIEIK